MLGGAVAAMTVIVHSLDRVSEPRLLFRCRGLRRCAGACGCLS